MTSFSRKPTHGVTPSPTIFRLDSLHPILFLLFMSVFFTLWMILRNIITLDVHVMVLLASDKFMRSFTSPFTPRFFPHVLWMLSSGLKLFSCTFCIVDLNSEGLALGYCSLIAHLSNVCTALHIVEGIGLVAGQEPLADTRLECISYTISIMSYQAILLVISKRVIAYSTLPCW